MKLYSYQEELVNSKSDRIMINWCRGAGKTAAIVEYILANESSLVLMDDKTFRGVRQHLEHSSMDRGVSIAISQDYIKFYFKGIGRTTPRIHRCPLSHDINANDYDLYVFERETEFNEKELPFKKVIKVMMDNTENYDYKNSKSQYETSVVDYKDAMKENALSTEFVVKAALGNIEGSFHREYAIKDKPVEEAMSFDTFKNKAVQRLQKQFLAINDSKDTVLTRKNIIEMIKDLQTIN